MLPRIEERTNFCGFKYHTSNKRVGCHHHHHWITIDEHRENKTHDIHDW